MKKYNIKEKISQIYHQQNIQLVMNLICVFIIVKFLFIILMTIKGVFNYTFYHHLDSEYQKEIVNKNLFTHTILLYTPIFLSFFAIIKKKIGLKEFTLAIIFSYLSNRFQVFDLIHSYIQNSFIFDYIRSKGRVIINNQYTRIVFYISLILILFLQVLIKKTRTLSRIMVLMITTSCLITVVIFHIAVPMGVFKSVLDDKTEVQKYEIENLKKEDVCKFKKCYKITNNQVEIISKNKKPENLKQYEFIINKGMYLINKEENYIFSESVNVNAGFLFDYDIITMKKEGSSFFIIIDDLSMRKFSRESEIMFSFLAIVAHFVWIFGGLLLLEFHYYKLKKRMLLEKEKDNK